MAEQHNLLCVNTGERTIPIRFIPASAARVLTRKIQISYSHASLLQP